MQNTVYYIVAQNTVSFYETKKEYPILFHKSFFCISLSNIQYSRVASLNFGRDSPLDLPFTIILMIQVLKFY